MQNMLLALLRQIHQNQCVKADPGFSGNGVFQVIGFSGNIPGPGMTKRCCLRACCSGMFEQCHVL
jgi:hypothetical protein